MATFKCMYCGKEFPCEQGYYNYPNATLCVHCNDTIFSGQKNMSVMEKVRFAQKAVAEKKLSEKFA